MITYSEIHPPDFYTCPAMSTSSNVVPLRQDLSPHNIALEQALLGALLARNKRIEDVVEFLDPEHFSERIHGDIYRAIRTLFEQGRTADDKTLTQYFLGDATFEQSGGAGYLKSLLDSVVSFVHVKDYGDTIYDMHLRRALIDLGDTIIQEAQHPKPDTRALDTVEDIEKQLFNLVTTGSADKTVVAFTDALSQAIARAEIAYKRDSHIIGITTGFLDMDRMLGGLHPSDLVIIAGRPSMGKTALATNMAFNAARAYKKDDEDSEGGAVAFFSLEMSSEQLAARILSCESGIPSDHIRRGELGFEDFPKFMNIARELSQLPLFIDDTPGLSITALRNRARRLKRQHNIKLIVIDYLQLLSGGGSKRSSENRVQEISEITRALKGLAKELDLPVIALSQLSRAVEQRDDKKPLLSDLRESGTIEQDADVVMFIYRQEYYESRKQPESGTEEHQSWLEKMERIHNKAEIIVAKQRHGPIGSVSLYYDGRLVKFGNLVK
jgi:replicative DNA helicase